MGGGGTAEAAPSRPACDAQDIARRIGSGVVLERLGRTPRYGDESEVLGERDRSRECLWGAFVATNPRGEPRGVLVVSYGNEAPGDARCAPGTDAILDELEPGDVVRIVGRASSFAPASCDGISPLRT